MSIKINFKNNILKKNSSNLVLFTDEKFSPGSIKRYISKSEFNYIADLLKTSDLKKNLLVFDMSSKKKIVLIAIKKDLKTFDIENLGAEFHGRINYGKKNEYNLNIDSVDAKYKDFINYFLHGFKLKSYEFNRYKSKVEKRILIINVIGTRKKFSLKNHLRFKALEKPKPPDFTGL